MSSWIKNAFRGGAPDSDEPDIFEKFEEPLKKFKATLASSTDRERFDKLMEQELSKEKQNLIGLVSNLKNEKEKSETARKEKEEEPEQEEKSQEKEKEEEEGLCLGKKTSGYAVVRACSGSGTTGSHAKTCSTQENP